MSKKLKKTIDAEEHKISHLDPNNIRMVNLNRILERSVDQSGK